MEHAMFHMQLPLVEKIVRPIIIYLVLIFLLRVFGKRELAQLNPFDLIVLLSLSNVVQNALIGEDNSVTGGIVGAASLLTINWLVVRFLYSSPRLDRLVEGGARVLVADGVVNEKALHDELLTHEELLIAVRRQGFDSVDDLKTCVLQPNGSFYIEARRPTDAEKNHAELIEQLRRIQNDLNRLEERLTAG